MQHKKNRTEQKGITPEQLCDLIKKEVALVDTEAYLRMNSNARKNMQIIDIIKNSLYY